MQLQNNIYKLKGDFLIKLKKEYSEIWDENIYNKLDHQIAERLSTFKKTLLSKSPYSKHYFTLTRAERDQKWNGGSVSKTLEDIEHYKELNTDVDTSFWLEKLMKFDNLRLDLNKNMLDHRTKYALTEADLCRLTSEENEKIKITAIRRNLQEAWRKDYEKLQLDWELNEIQKLRNQILKKYSDWLDKIHVITKALNSLGLDNGILWDLSPGSLTAQDIAQLKRWAEYLQNDENLKKLCELMGKLSKESKSQKNIQTQVTQRYEIPEIDINSSEEIAGIKLGNDLENVLPQELSNLTDPDISILFDLKFIESRLVCFEKQGYKMAWEEEVIYKDKQVHETEKKGPIIICIDTSGSMSGAPETIAKALTLVLATKAANQRRACYLINFSTSIETIDLQPPKGIADLIHFLNQSFHGGTDITPALNEAVQKMQKEKYTKADLLMISDFVFSVPNKPLRDAIEKQKLNGNRFYTLSIGQFNLTDADELFDFYWKYDSANGTITELNSMIERVADTELH